MKRTIFVFGSNLKGQHSAGAAKFAAGAVEGQGRGIQGQSYGIPTKDEFIRTLPLDDIRENVEQFLRYATDHPELRFFVTRVGCGLAGYEDADVAPFFTNCPANCDLDPRWVKLVGASSNG